MMNRLGHNMLREREFVSAAEGKADGATFEYIEANERWMRSARCFDATSQFGTIRISSSIPILLKMPPPAPAFMSAGRLLNPRP